jgi:hypothetical protein
VVQIKHPDRALAQLNRNLAKAGAYKNTRQPLAKASGNLCRKALIVTLEAKPFLFANFISDKFELLCGLCELLRLLREVFHAKAQRTQS